MVKFCNVGIIGLGRIGKLHAENVKLRMPQFSLHSIADPYVDAAWVKSLSPDINIETDYQVLLSNPEIDAILITSPSKYHVQHVIEASNSGKAIFCEKPLGFSEESIQQVIATITKNKTLLQVGFNRRFDPNFSSIHRRIREGVLGKPYLLRITSRDPMPPSADYIATSGGIFMDMTIHDFDMARFLSGSEVVEIYVVGANLIDPEIKKFDDVDTALIQLRFANGMLGMIDNSRKAVYGYDQRVEIFGSNANLLANNQNHRTVELLNEASHYSSKPLYFFLERYQAAFIAELEAFYQAWLQQTESPVSAIDGLQAFRIAQAAKQSCKLQKPVTIAH